VVNPFFPGEREFLFPSVKFRAHPRSPPFSMFSPACPSQVTITAHPVGRGVSHPFFSAAVDHVGQGGAGHFFSPLPDPGSFYRAVFLFFFSLLCGCFASTAPPAKVSRSFPPFSHQLLSSLHVCGPFSHFFRFCCFPAPLPSGCSSRFHPLPLMGQILPGVQPA